MLIEKKIKRAFFLLSWVFLIVNVQATESYKKDAAVSDARLLVFPDNKREPFLNAIQNAQQSIQLAAYKLSDLAVMEALKKAAERGCHIPFEDMKFLEPGDEGFGKEDDFDPKDWVQDVYVVTLP